MLGSDACVGVLLQKLGSPYDLISVVCCLKLIRMFAFVVQLLREMGAVELLFTSDSQYYLNESVLRKPAEEVLLTVNFMNDGGGLDRLKEIQVRHSLHTNTHVQNTSHVHTHTYNTHLHTTLLLIEYNFKSTCH